MDAAVFNTLQRIASTEDEVQKEVLKEETNAELAAHFSHPGNRGDLEELAYDVFNQAWADAMSEDIVPKIIEVKNAGLTDIDYIDEDLRGMRAYWQGKGGQILSDVVRYERTLMPREEMVTAIDIHLDEIRANFWGPLANLQGQANEKLRQLPTMRLVELVQAAINAGTYYGTFAASTLTAAQLDSIIDEVAAKSGGEVSILGTRIATRYLAGVGMEFGQNVAEQVFRTGQIGQYKGNPVVQVENFEDFAGNFVLPNDELWIVGRKAGRLTFYGGDAKVQTLQLPSFYLRWETAKDAGMLLYGAQKGRIGRIKLT
jgi:hypothetical protein